MNMLVFSKKIILATVFVWGLVACKKETVYTYEVEEVVIDQPGVEKPNVKTNTQYISIAHSDVLGTTVSQTKLSELEIVYLSFADKSVIEDLIIRNFLNNSETTIPTSSEMEADVESFVVNAYKKVFNREPSEYELYYQTKQINESDLVTPELFYYALLTSNEYRQY